MIRRNNGESMPDKCLIVRRMLTIRLSLQVERGDLNCAKCRAGRDGNPYFILISLWFSFALLAALR
ncbi:MAG: hypothetical protein ACYST3_06080 [Planctomycetota bacterium]